MDHQIDIICPQSIFMLLPPTRSELAGMSDLAAGIASFLDSEEDP